MKLNALIATAAVSAALIALVGCEQQTDQPPTGRAPSYGQDGVSSASPPVGPLADRSASASPESARGVGQTLEDATITAKVKAALLASSDVQGSAIKVDTDRGRVTLKGKVTDVSQIDRAVQIARAVDGVETVDSQLSTRDAS